MFRLAPSLSSGIRSCSRSVKRKLEQSLRLASSAGSEKVCNDERFVPEKPVKEIQIPVPWGHISGRWWGPENQRPIIGLHGWQDNAGTWDRLAPMLPSHISLLALDFPGHGLSSHYHPGRLYHFLEYVSCLRRVMTHYDWPRVSLLTHSLGSIVAFAFSALYPEMVDNYVAIDAMKPYSGQPLSSVRKAGKSVDAMLKASTLDPCKAPAYSYQEARDRLVQGTHGSVTEEASRFLLDRGLEAASDGRYRYRRDPRLKVQQVISWSHGGILEFASHIRCHVLHINAVPGLTYDTEERHKEVSEVVSRSAKSYKYCDVQGTHHLHLTDPGSVAPIINKFLEDHPQQDG